MLRSLKVSYGTAELDSLLHVCNRILECAACEADGPRSRMYTRYSEAACCRFVPALVVVLGIFSPQNVFSGDPEFIE